MGTRGMANMCSVEAVLIVFWRVVDVVVIAADGVPLDTLYKITSQHGYFTNALIH